jgi:branched-chain amino acid transport system permease protein
VSELLAVLLLGLGPGALVAGLAQALVIGSRGTGTVNLAIGGVGMLAAYVYFSLREGGYLFFSQLSFGGPVATVPAMALTLAVAALFGLAIDRFVNRPLRHASTLTKLLAALGLLEFLQSAVALRFGSQPQVAPNVLPNGPDDVVHLLGATVASSQLWVIAIVLVLGIALAAAYRFTKVGVASNAVVQNEAAAQYAGVSPNAISSLNTVLSFLIAGLLGVLVAPLVQLDTSTIALLVIPALGAALLAGFDSIVAATGAGIALGLLQALLTYLQSRTWFPTVGGQQTPGLSDVVYLLVIGVAMVWRGSRFTPRGLLHDRRLPAAPRPPASLRPAVLILAVGAVAFLVLPVGLRQALIYTTIGVLVCLSLVIVIGYVGQVSVLQVSLGGIAAFALSDLAERAGIGFPLAPVIAIAAAVIVGLATASVAARVRDVNLAIVTLAAAVAAEQFVFDNPSWGGGANPAVVPELHAFGIDLGPYGAFPVNGGQPSPVFGFVCLVCAVGVAVLVVGLRRSVLGERMLAVRSNEHAAAASGIAVGRVRLVAFGVSSAVAGLAGVLYAYNFRSVAPSSFGFATALAFVAAAYIGGITSITGATIAAFGVTGGVLGYALTNWLDIQEQYQLLLGGALLIFTIVKMPGGLAPQFTAGLRRLARLPARMAPSPAARLAAAGYEPEPEPETEREVAGG